MIIENKEYCCLFKGLLLFNGVSMVEWWGIFLERSLMVCLKFLLEIREIII